MHSRKRDMKAQAQQEGVRLIKTGLVLTGLAAAAVVAVSAVSLVTVPLRSATGVVERTLDSGNVLRTYELFHDRHTAFDARVRQIMDSDRNMASERDPVERNRIRAELAAQKQSCRDIAAAYNADAAKTNRSIFQGRDLPERLDINRCN